MFALKIVRIFKYIWIFKQFLHSNTLTNEYPNIFVQSNLTRTNVRIYSYRKIDTNECPNKYSWQIYSNIGIFEYIRHTLLGCHIHVVNSVATTLLRYTYDWHINPEAIKFHCHPEHFCWSRKFEVFESLHRTKMHHIS